MEKRTLQEIAEIRSGMNLQIQNKGDVYYLQIKDINNDDMSLRNDIALVKLNETQKKHILLPGDILFVSKGYRHGSLLFSPLPDHPSVASTSFIVIRPDRKKILPEYLCWYMNREEALNLFNIKNSRNKMPSVNKNELIHLPIEVPGLEMQKGIVNTLFLHRREIEIQHKLIELRKEEMDMTLIQLIRKS